METIQLFSDVDLPAQHMLSNLITNTQPDNILKYKYVYGNWDTNEWIKMFIVPMAVRSVLFSDGLFSDIEGAIKIKLNSRSYVKIKMLIPDLLFIVNNSILVAENAELNVFQINGQFDVNDLSNISNAPLPNLYESGMVCQSGKLSILKTCKNSESYVLKNSFEISEYYIDVFLNSAFNNDLDGTWINTIKKMGFSSTVEYMNTVTNPHNFSFAKEKFMKKISFNLSSFKNKFLRDDKFEKIQLPMSLFKNDYLKMDVNDEIFKININNDICNNTICVGDNIKYKGEFVKVLSFGPSVTNSNLYLNLSEFRNDHYIKYITESFEIGIIPFSEIKEKVNLGELIKLDENLYPKGYSKNNFVLHQNNYYRIMEIFKIEGNNKYILKLSNHEYGKFLYSDIANYVGSSSFDEISQYFDNQQYYSDTIYSYQENKIISIDVTKLYSSEYVKDRLMVKTRYDTIFLHEKGENIKYFTNKFIDANFFELLEIVDEEHTISYDNNMIPHMTELYSIGERGILYGKNIDPDLYTIENIDSKISEIVDKWNKQGKSTNTKIFGKYESDICFDNDLLIDDTCYRLPILQVNDGYCDQYILKSFEHPTNSQNVYANFQSKTDGKEVSIPLWYILKFDKSELFKSENDADTRYIDQYVSLKNDVHINRLSETCIVANRRKTIKIIDIDFSSSIKYNRFFASDNVIYCIDKKYDPFNNIFDKKSKNDFFEHEQRDIIMSDVYVSSYYIPNSILYDNLSYPKYNQVELYTNGEFE